MTQYTSLKTMSTQADGFLRRRVPSRRTIGYKLPFNAAPLNSQAPAPANRVAEADVQISEALRRSPAYAALFDPQTCGGMLLGAPEEKLESVMHSLTSVLPHQPAVIGTCSSDGAGELRVV